MTQPLDIRHPWLKSRSRQRRVAELLVVHRTLRKSNALHKSHFPAYPCAISHIYVSLPTCASCGECVILSISINKEDFIGTICVVSFNTPSIAALGWCYMRVVHWYVCRFYFYLLAYLFVGVLVHLYICGFKIVFVRLVCLINLFTRIGNKKM